MPQPQENFTMHFVVDNIAPLCYNYYVIEKRAENKNPIKKALDS
jgi:hypothetical protein